MDGSYLMPMHIEHWHRYKIAKKFCKDKTVLDAACGTGYGSHLVAQEAKEVFGVDISQEAIDYCEKNYVQDNLQFKQASVDNMPFPDEFFDVIISFETIEHIDEKLQNKFLLEIKRVLKPEGMLIMSSPDKASSSQNEINSFHIHELNKNEFCQLIKSKFKYSRYANQIASYASLIQAENNTSDFNYYITEKTGNRSNISEIDEFPAVFNIAFASDEPIPELKNSINIDKNNCILEDSVREVIDYIDSPQIPVEFFYNHCQDRVFSEERKKKWILNSSNNFIIDITLEELKIYSLFRIDVGKINVVYEIKKFYITDDNDKIVWDIFKDQYQVANAIITDVCGAYYLVPTTNDPCIFFDKKDGLVFNTCHMEIVYAPMSELIQNYSRMCCRLKNFGDELKRLGY
jgi:ubiquinone/menaquinone biosynthesis C-methylase UbiE